MKKAQNEPGAARYGEDDHAAKSATIEYRPVKQLRAAQRLGHSEKIFRPDRDVEMATENWRAWTCNHHHTGPSSAGKAQKLPIQFRMAMQNQSGNDAAARMRGIAGWLSVAMFKEPGMALRNSLLVLAMLMVVGCQQSSMVGSYPSPNFSGPVISQVASVPAYKPTPMPTAPQVRSQRGDVAPAAWIPPRTAEKRQWSWIVIHHSATPTGNASKFDREHKAKGWDELGYHFVIGNGTGSGDGQVEVGPRWPKQKWGAHAKTADNQFNEHGIGICLVGNFDVQRPTAAQQQSLAKLVAYLMKTYNVPPQRILGHGMTKATDCPGKNISIASIRKLATQVLVAEGTPVPANTGTASAGELLRDR